MMATRPRIPKKTTTSRPIPGTIPRRTEARSPADQKSRACPGSSFLRPWLCAAQKKPRRSGAFPESADPVGSALFLRPTAIRLRRDHEVVEGVFGNPPPQDFLVAERRPVVVDLLELRVGRRCNRTSTRLNSSHYCASRMPTTA